MCDYKIFSSKLKDVINLDEDLVDIKHYLINKLDLLILRNVKPRQFLRPHNFSPQHYFFSMILYPIRTSLSLSLSLRIPCSSLPIASLIPTFNHTLGNVCHSSKIQSLQVGYGVWHFSCSGGPGGAIKMTRKERS